MNRPCKRCGTNDRYPCGSCKRCTVQRNRQYRSRARLGFVTPRVRDNEPIIFDVPQAVPVEISPSDTGFIGCAIDAVYGESVEALRSPFVWPPLRRVYIDALTEPGLSRGRAA